MIEITQVHASLDEAGDEKACLIVGKRVVKRVLRCKDFRDQVHRAPPQVNRRSQKTRRPFYPELSC